MHTNAATKSVSPSSAKKDQEKPYSLFLPFTIVMVVLIVSAARETSSLHKQKMAFLTQNQQSVEALDRSSKQTDAVRKLRDDLHTLAATDPVAAKIMVEYFPQGNSLSQNTNGN